MMLILLSISLTTDQENVLVGIHLPKFSSGIVLHSLDNSPCLQSRQRGQPPSAAHRTALCFFLLKHRLHLPQEATALEPVNSRNVLLMLQCHIFRIMLNAKEKKQLMHCMNCSFSGTSNRTRLSDCGPRSVAALTVHRTVIHYRSPFESPKKSQKEKITRMIRMIFLWRLKQDSNL